MTRIELNLFLNAAWEVTIKHTAEVVAAQILNLAPSDEEAKVMEAITNMVNEVPWAEVKNSIQPALDRAIDSYLSNNGHFEADYLFYMGQQAHVIADVMSKVMLVHH
jgi:hypothetical protein